MKKQKLRIGIYVLLFLLGAALLIVNMRTFDVKAIVTVVLLSLIGALIIGTVINILINLLSDQKETQEEK